MSLAIYRLKSHEERPLIVPKNRLSLAKKSKSSSMPVSESSDLQPMTYESFQMDTKAECLFASLQAKFSQIDDLMGELSYLNKEIQKSLKN